MKHIHHTDGKYYHEDYVRELEDRLLEAEKTFERVRDFVPITKLEEFFIKQAREYWDKYKKEK